MREIGKWGKWSRKRYAGVAENQNNITRIIQASWVKTKRCNAGELNRNNRLRVYIYSYTYKILKIKYFEMNTIAHIL